MSMDSKKVKFVYDYVILFGLQEPKVGSLYLVCDPPMANYRGRVLSAEEGEEGRVKVSHFQFCSRLGQCKVA